MDYASIAGVSIGQKVMVTTDNWFFGPDGKSYRGVWGTLIGILGDQETLGIKTNARSTNWYIQVGDTLLAGCQVHYAIACDKKPADMVEDYSVVDGEVRYYTRPSSIHCADQD